MTERFITFGVDAGGSAAGSTCEPFFMALRKSLARNTQKAYGEIIKEFAFVLRIDGDIGYWKKTGCDYLRVTPKHGYATVDIFMSEEIWRDGDGGKIRDYLAEHAETGFNMMLNRVKQKKIPLDAELLTSDFERAIGEFRAQPIPVTP
jgi:hypothetical protein